MLEMPFGWILFPLSFSLFYFVLKEIKFPVLFLSKAHSKKTIQLIVITIVLLLIPFTIKLLSMKFNQFIYYYIYLPLYITTFIRVFNVMFQEKKN